MKDDFEVFAGETRSNVIGRTAGRMGSGGEIRHSTLNMVKFEMPIVHPSRHIKYSNGYMSLDFIGEVQAREIGSM